MPKGKVLTKKEFVQIKYMLNVGITRKNVVVVSKRSLGLIDKVKKASDYDAYKAMSKAESDAYIARQAQATKSTTPVFSKEMDFRRFSELIVHLFETVEEMKEVVKKYEKE